MEINIGSGIQFVHLLGGQCWNQPALRQAWKSISAHKANGLSHSCSKTVRRLPEDAQRSGRYGVLGMGQNLYHGPYPLGEPPTFSL